MDESSWLACSDPRSMLEFLGESASERKRRLFASGCCRRVWSLLGNNSCKAVKAAEKHAEGILGPEALRRTREAAARCREGNTKWRSLQGRCAVAANAAACSAAGEGDVARAAAHHAAAASAVLDVEGRISGRLVSVMGAGDSGLRLAWWRRHYRKDRRMRDRRREARVTQNSEDAWWAESRAQADLLRCVFSPFRPAGCVTSSAWLTPVVESLACAAYEERSLPSGELDPLRLAVLADALEESGCLNEVILAHLREAGPHVRGCFALDALLGNS
jgi:hypothetical protein